MKYTFDSVIEKLDSEVWSVCFFVPEEISLALNEGTDRRVICTLNDQELFHGALMPAGNGAYFINVNKELRKKLRLDLGNKVHVHLEKDHSQYGMPMPEEFEELLLQDEEGSRFFHALTIGKQRTLIHLVYKLKSVQKRLEKGIVILEYLKSVQGQLDHRELNMAFKNSRFK